jgi:hypothetical protein
MKTRQSPKRIFEHNLQQFEELTATTTDGYRVYRTPQGHEYPSVTTILGAASDNTWKEEWRKRVGDAEVARISALATRRGSAVHELAEDYLLNRDNSEKSIMPANALTFEQIKIELDKHIGTIYGIECPLYSNTLKTAGRCDLLAEFDGELAVVDFKTSKKLKTEEDIENYFIQATCYTLMAQERLPHLSINKIAIIMAVDDEPKASVFIKSRNKYIKRVLDIFVYNRPLINKK